LQIDRISVFALMKLRCSADRKPVRIARLIALASIAAALSYAQPNAGLWRFVQPDAHAIIGLDWKRAGHSELGQWLREQWLGSAAAAVTGPEFLDSVDHILMSSAGAREAKQEAPLLIAIQGRFDPAKLRKSLLARGAKVQVFESMAIYRPPGKDARDLAFAPLDAHIVLAGDAHSVYEAIEKSRTPAGDDTRSELLARARRMDAAYDCWALLQAPGALASERFTLGVFGAEEFSADARSIEAGISFREGMVLRAAVTARSESAAKKTAGDFEKLIKLAARDRVAQPALALFASKLKIGVGRATVLISANISEPETVKLAGRLTAAKDKPVIDIALEESKRPVIRIEGLDDGPREVPYRP
jgi:hypothetical protein